MAEEKKAEVLTYHRDRLIAEAEQIFGQPSHIVVAALTTGRASNKLNFTRDEAEKLVNDALKHQVTIDHPDGEEA